MPAKPKPKPTEAANDPRAEWRGMPECVNEDLSPFRTISVHFTNAGDVEAFAALIGQKITPRMKSAWYPPVPPARFADQRYVSES